MAAAIKCDACGRTCEPKEAKHVRIHKLKDAENYATPAIEYFDVCNECYNKLSAFLNQKGDNNDNTRTS